MLGRFSLRLWLRLARFSLRLWIRLRNAVVPRRRLQGLSRTRLLCGSLHSHPRALGQLSLSFLLVLQLVPRPLARRRALPRQLRHFWRRPLPQTTHALESRSLDLQPPRLLPLGRPLPLLRVVTLPQTSGC